MSAYDIKDQLKLLPENTLGRIQYVDVAKGIGVILRLIGHQPAYIPGWMQNWIYSFHMPMFFIIAGFFMMTKDWFLIT